MRIVLTCFLLGSILNPNLGSAENAPAGAIADWQVKAAYLYQFGSYIEWPDNVFADRDSPLTIGVVDADALAGALSKIVANHTVNGRSVVVRKMRADEAPSGVNVLFIGGGAKDGYTDKLAALKGQPVLIVTESDEAIAHGSMINFVLVDGRVRFEAAPKAARQNNLTISARLLAAAYRVVSGAT